MKVAFLTAGGIAPCLSSAIASLANNYYKRDCNISMIGYLHGYKGLLQGNSISFDLDSLQNIEALYNFGGSLIGNSRVKLTNIDDCIKNDYIKKGENPLKVAADQLIKDNVSVLHTIGGDDTNTAAGDLVEYLNKYNYNLTVVGLPKTIDNDVSPIKQTLGAWTAAEQGAVFFENIVNENTTSSRHLIIHEIMGRNCGWLTAVTAMEYRTQLKTKKFVPSILLDKNRWDIDAIYIPEMEINIDYEISRLKSRLDQKDSVNIFLSEGACIENIIEEMEKSNINVKRDAFGHVRLDEVNPGQWLAKQFSYKIDANKVLVQKSGYFARSAKPNNKDLNLIFKTADYAVDCAFKGISGVVGLDEENNNKLNCINFSRIKGGKKFDPKVEWFQNMLSEIGQ